MGHAGFTMNMSSAFCFDTMKTTALLACTLSLLGTQVAQAESSTPSERLWQDNSLTYVTGGRFRVDPAAQQTLTFEHASGWRHGDLFVFIDATHFNDGRGGSLYGEFSPRVSLSKLGKTTLPAHGLIRDVALSSTLEFGEGEVETLLMGLGLDLAVPGMDFFKLDLLRRIPLLGQDGEIWQLTPVWSASMGRHLVFDGFIDWGIHSDGRHRRNWHVNPQLKYDIGAALGWGKRKLMLGVEYSYWHNKYGIADSAAFPTHDNTASFILQTYF